MATATIIRQSLTFLTCSNINNPTRGITICLDEKAKPATIPSSTNLFQLVEKTYFINRYIKNVEKNIAGMSRKVVENWIE
jgi:hypothetical protein